MSVNQLEALLKEGEVTPDQELICKKEINAVLDRTKYDLDKAGAPEVINNVQTNHTNYNGSTSTNEPSTGVATLVSLFGWLICVISLILAFVSFAQASRMGVLAVIPVLSVFVGGLLLVIAGQATRAMVRNASYTKQLLELIRAKT